MAKFSYNNTKSASTGHNPFELNYGYYSKALLENKTDFCSKFCYANKLAQELRELIKICCQNLFHV